MIDEYSLSDLYRKMELELVESLKRNLAAHTSNQKLTDTRYEQWQATKLRELRRFQRENRLIVLKYQPEVQTLIDEIIKQSYTFNTGFFAINDGRVLAIINELQNTFTLADGLMLRQMDDVYRDVIGRELVSLGTGTTTIRQAIDASTRDFLDKGLNVIQYENGNKVNVASYAEMAMRAGNQKATFYEQGNRRAQLKVYTVLMSTHANCSNLCLPWQGTVMIDDVYSGLSEEEAIQLSRETGYERLSVAMENGAFHPNCRHSLSTFFPGKSTLPKQLTEDERAEALRRYKEEQHQRYLERNVRKWKRVVAGEADAENAAKAKAKVKEWQLKLREHIAANRNLRREYWRERA